MDLATLYSNRSQISYLRLSKVLFTVEIHHKHVGGLHELFLYAAGRNIDLVFMAYTCSSSSTSHLA